MTLSGTSRQSAEPLAVAIVESDVAVVQRDRDNPGTGNGEAVDRRVNVNAHQRTPHIPQIPYPNTPVVGAGNDLIFSGENC